jgi:hypothetical protein
MSQNPNSAFRWQQVAILVGTALFLLALACSAILDPRLRLLHALQALIYVAILLLTRYNSPWGFGIGTIVPAAWNCMNLFLTTSCKPGQSSFGLFSVQAMPAGSFPSQWPSAASGISFSYLPASSAFFRLRPGLHQRLRFIAGGVLAMAYLALIVRLTIGHGV